MDIQEHVNLRNHTSFHVDAYARYFISVTTIEMLKSALSFATQRKIPFLLIGEGSNLLFQQDYPGLVVEMNIKGRTVLESAEDTCLVKAQGGENWHEFVLWTLSQQLYGLENLSLIPGTVGAAPVQNIGAYGVELCEHLSSLDALEVATGEIHTLTKAQCEFSYRHSLFKGAMKGKFIICSVTFTLNRKANVNLTYGALAKVLDTLPDAEITPELVSQTVSNIRRSKLPDPEKLGNAGSFFRNPEVSIADFERLKSVFPDLVGYPSSERVKLAAAWLIEAAGWKGYRDGDAGVHQDHALVLVNYGHATGTQLKALAEAIQSSVHHKFGIKLIPEVGII